ncbi:RfbD dTDP-4-dehydrorhamnose reductase [uncultured Caudovirales phage]|uniref:RfbD dTDP-4-dehydrorhamnose reductase n=1 Tax=uncultured Caudovirales phage TaxID=2100421 RepID=A0A6J5LFN4_9CAUD|nr:RfbD dTDP-4-dehydrorhamnose reductase [uncultured Caudovirales phage]
MEKVLVVGENSFIGKHLTKFDRVSFKNFDEVDLENYDVVVNCALNPLYKTEKYKEAYDADWYVGRKTCNYGLHYVMLSTSKVYGDSKELVYYTENSQVNPYDYHSENKLNTEFKLLSNYGNKITILRGSNIFGFEYGRNSFVGYCMTKLVNEGIIEYNISQMVRRDFLYIDDAVDLIERVCAVKPFGVYNLSSNYALPIGKVAEYLIAGYSYGGQLKLTGWEKERQFALENGRLSNILGMKIGPFDYEKIFNDLGKQLCKI